MSTRPLVTVVVLFLIATAFSTIFAILNKLPYEFGGTGNPETVAVDSISHGTAISPPLTALVIFAALTALTFRRGWLGIVGLVGDMLLTVLFLVAGLAEPIIRRTLQAPSLGVAGVATIGLSAVNIVLLLLLLFFGVKELRARRQQA